MHTWEPGQFQSAPSYSLSDTRHKPTVVLKAAIRSHLHMHVILLKGLVHLRILMRRFSPTKEVAVNPPARHFKNRVLAALPWTAEW